MADKTPVIPTFHAGPTTVLKKKEDIITYVLQFMFANPGWTSSFHESEMISFRVINANAGRTPTRLADSIQEALQNCFRRYFPNDAPMVTVGAEDVEENGAFGLSILVSDALGNPIVPMKKIGIDADGNLIPETVSEA